MSELRMFLRSKLHHAHVTETNKDYVGSLAIDASLMRIAGIEDGEQIHVWAVDHGARIVTYAIPGAPGQIVVNGGGAHHFKPGDRVIIATFCMSAKRKRPKVLTLNQVNRIVKP